MEHTHATHFKPYTLETCFGTRYTDQVRQFEAELAPLGILEVVQAAMIIGCHLRLAAYDQTPEPNSPELERARTATSRNLASARRELRQLQADRVLKAKLKAETGIELPGIPRVVVSNRSSSLGRNPGGVDLILNRPGM